MLITILSVLPIVLGFGVLIFVHELGHFLAAKWAGIRAEAFAVGMGPIALAWRRGIGLRAGSTYAEHRRRVRTWLEHEGRWSGPADREPPLDRVIEAEQALSLDETEYSLRWLPIGGFVKMLGQDDLAPDALSSHPRSYQRASIPRRMVVVSAGVVMNLLLAVVLFVVAFLAGVRFEAPIAGGAMPGSPAAAAMPVDAGRLGIDEPGIQPGDRIVRAGDHPVRTFGDITLAVAMSHPGEPLVVDVDRPGVTEPVRFEIEPVRDPATRLRSIGVGLARGPRLLDGPKVAEELARSLDGHPELAAALAPGMEVLSVGGRPVRTWDEVVAAAGDDGADGRPLETLWRSSGSSEPVSIPLPVEPDYDLLAWPLPPAGGDAASPGISVEPGLLGLVQPLVVRDFDPSSPNRDRLAPGDVLVSVAG
ncbi:MAG: site-2 protease family protein, partial [Planctomycetota bacterium]